ncbi:outer membrane beta-barrel protein [Polymorphobacter sp. PAMC 29334]|uniref:outer membrane beta-barrel protein n=1 Tax=Polymorphobacter sp. PAMC 29334 TaxID=2862331 RepID=UPI001C792A42|nr:outer membrane beta-barrel protein [Polymorphobacter sp. PAMC 29334]QYE35058.1 outer membrane beta-barrel protein [Polymorphobacter sp. PAMC 29334]
MAGGRRVGAIAFLLCCPIAAAVSSEFVSVDRDNIVLARERPELDALGIPAGGFRIYPSLTVGTIYDTNVFDRATGTGDGFLQIGPKITVQSGWSQNFLRFTGDAEIERFARIHSENNERYGVDALARVDVTHNMVVELDALFGRRAETRGSSGDVVAGSRPIIFYDAGGHISLTTTAGAVTAKGRLDLDDYRYNDAQVGNQFFSQRYRDHRATTALVELSFPLTPAISAVTSASFNDSSYTNTLPGLAPLDSNGFTTLAGVRFGVSSVTTGQITAGYLRQSYRAAVFPTIEGVNYDARIVWNPTTLLAITATANRSIEPSPIANVAGIVADGAGAKADYEVLRNLLVNLRADYLREAYRGSDRRDRRVSAGAGIRYMINRTLQLGVQYDFRDQTSRGAGARPYRGSDVLLQLTVQR